MAAIGNDYDCTQVLKHRYPPAPEGGVASCPPVAGPSGTIVAYGFPPPVKYGYAGCQS